MSKDPKTENSVTGTAASALVDQTPAHEEVRLRSALGEIQRQAAESGDSHLENVARCERNVVVVFDDLRSVEAYANAISELFPPEDLTYLRDRSRATTNPRARSRYLHAIAAITKRSDDGIAAAQGYLDTFRDYRLQPREQNKEAFAALHDLIPVMKLLCRRYKLTDGFRAEALEFLLDGDLNFRYIKAELFRLILSDTKSFSVEELGRLEAFSLELLHAMRAGDEKDIIATAEAGRKLADRLGRSYDDCHRAEAAALEERIDIEPNPMRTGIVGTRLLRLYQLLKDEDARQRVIVRMREGRAGMKYVTFSGQPDNWKEHVEFFRGKARRLVREHGPMATLLWLATTRELIPSVESLKRQLEAMREQGVGVWRQFATTVVSTDERMLSQHSAGEDSSHEFDEQYGIHWMFGAVLPFSIFMSELAPPDEIRLEHMEKLLRESWLGRDEDISYGGDIKMPNDLVALLMSGLRLYFQLVKEEGSADAVIPALDTLVLRMEAVLRKLARLLDVPSIKATDSRGRPMAEHAGIELLENEKLLAACGDDLLTFAKYTLDRKPEGLRNRIGHAILHYRQYDMVTLDAVVFLLLRLAAVPIMTADEDRSATGTDSVVSA